jgi:D-amino-acid dehydrogenase
MHSEPQRHERISEHHARLIAPCLTEHEALIAKAGAADLVRRTGYLAVFREQRSFQEAARLADRLREAKGVRHAVLDAEALAAAEPALRRRLAGAIHWLDPWAVSDPGELVARYAALFEREGGRLAIGDAATLQPASGGWRVRTQDGTIEASQAVVALGPWSDALLRSLGYKLPLFVKRGYHRHYEGAPGPRLTMLDADRGVVLAPMRQGVRVTTGAEFADLGAPPTPVQLERAEVIARELFELPRPVEEQPWMGARPCTPDMLPVMGPAPRHPGLWFNFGHAHQGFTLGAVSGRLLAEMIEGDTPAVDPAPYAAARFL